MQVVYEAWNLIDAYLVRHALEDTGIPVFVRGETLLGGVGELPACGLVAVCVPDSCWPQARALVESLPLIAGEPGDDAVDRVPPDGALPA
jgi:hypothetical protein